MIKLLGVIAEGGTLITVKTFREIEEKQLVSNLIEATKGISEVMGVGKIKRFDFGEDRLILTETKKNYTIVALTDTAERYIDQLLQVIARDLDNNEVIPHCNLVNESLEESIEGIIETYMNDELSISLHETVNEVWDPILTEAKKNKKIIALLEELNKDIEASSGVEAEKWHEFKSNIEEDPEKAIELALDGDFDHAFAVSLGSDDLLQKMFSIKMGLLSFSMLGMNSPPLNEIEELVEELPSDNPYANLLRMEIQYKKQEIARPNLLHAFGRATTKFQFKDNKKHRILSFLFLNEANGFFPEFGSKLADYFRDKSNVISTYINTMIERVRIIRKAYSITEADDIQEELHKWEKRVNNATESLNKVLKPGFIKRLLRRAPRGAEANRITLRCLMDIEVYMLLQAMIAQSPVLAPTERREKLNEVINIYLNYFRKAINKNLPMPSYTLVNALQNLALATQELLTMPTPNGQSKNIKNVRKLFKDTIEITVNNTTKITPYMQIILSVSDALSVPSPNEEDKEELPLNKGFLLLHSILKTTNIQSVESWKGVFPYNFAAYIINLLLALLPLALKFLEGKKKAKVIKKCVDKLIDTLKWLLFRGKVSRSTLLALAYYTTKIVDEYSTKELEQLMDTLIGFSLIAVPDWEEKDFDLAVLGEYLLETLTQASERLSNPEHLLQIGRKIYRISLNAWETYGYQKKARKLKEKYGDILGEPPQDTQKSKM